MVQIVPVVSDLGNLTYNQSQQRTTWSRGETTVHLDNHLETGQTYDNLEEVGVVLFGPVGVDEYRRLRQRKDTVWTSEFEQEMMFIRVRSRKAS